MTTRDRIINPYGNTLRDIVPDKTQSEAKFYGGYQKYGQQERFGGPHRSERYETERQSSSGRRTPERRRRSPERQGGRRSEDRRGEDRRGEGRRGEDRRGEDRSRTKSPARAKSPRRSNRPTPRKELQKEEEQEFETLNKDVILPESVIKEIRKTFSEQMEDPFDIVEAIVDAGHDTTTYFAKGSKVNRVFTFVGKMNDELKAKLESPKITFYEDTFHFVPPEVSSPYILFFYPYWLINMEDTQMVSFKDIPIHTGGTFHDILSIEHPDLFAFLVPKDLPIPDVYGEKEEIELDKGKLVFIRPKPSKASFLKEEKREVSSSKNYDEQFLKFIRGLLSSIAKEETIQKLVNSKTLPIWKKAFTHETIDLNENYEQLETIGDRVLELVFLKYLLRRYPDLTPQEITNLKSKYMSKIFQGTTARKLGLGNWIRVGNDISSISILEDVYESLFGALFEIADSEIYDGAGYVMALKLQSKIFDDTGMDLTYAEGHPRSQIKEIFEMLKLDVPEPEEINTDRGVSIRIRMSPETRESLVLLEMMKPDSPLVIGEGFGPYKTSAVNLAYSNALEYLKNLGITRAWAEDEKQMLDFLGPEIEPYLAHAIKRMEKEGFQRFYVRTPRVSVKTNNVVVQLVGEYFDKEKNKIQKQILFSGKYPEIGIGKIEVVKNYALGK